MKVETGVIVTGVTGVIVTGVTGVTGVIVTGVQKASKYHGQTETSPREIEPPYKAFYIITV